MTNLKYEVWMNNVALSSISGAIYVSRISYKPASMRFNTAEVAGRNGERVESVKRKGTTVTVSFYLKKTDNINRQEIVQAVAAWAKEGILQTSDRPHTRLHVRCVDFPFVSDVCDWLTPVTIVFQTFEQPFWEEMMESVLTLSGSSGSGSLYVPGNAGKALVEVTVTPSSSMENITLTVGSTSITLTGVSATSSSPVTITYDENGIQKILRGTTSVLSKRTGNDDLIAECGGSNAVSFSASAAASVTFRTRGLWL